MTLHLHAFYQTYPDLLKEALPNGYAYISTQYASIEARNSATVDTGSTAPIRTGSVEKDSTRTAEPVARTRDTTELGTDLSERKPAGQLDALTATPEEIKAEKAKPYKDRNLLVEGLACCPEALRVGAFGWPSGAVCSLGLIYCIAPSTAFGS